MPFVDLYQFLFNKILPKGINNLLFLNVESLINDVSYGLISYVYDFIFIKLNLFSLTKIFRIVIINWWRILIYLKNSFNIFIIPFDIATLLLDIKILRYQLMQRKRVETESVTHNYYNSSTKPKFHKNTRLIGKIIEKTSLTNFY